jgi:hypothetical protein
MSVLILHIKIETEYHLKPSPYRAVNTLSLSYKNQSVKVV